MTSEELDELIEKAVNAFGVIEGVELELAEKLVEQGILSYDDLSIMEIPDLVSTIEGLTEEQATILTQRAEELAEAQTDDMPRRKGARVKDAPLPEPGGEGERVQRREDETADGSSEPIERGILGRPGFSCDGRSRVAESSLT